MKQLIKASLLAFVIFVISSCQEQPFNKELLNNVVNRVLSGELKEGNDGIVLLPTDLQSASVDGKVTVVRPDAKQTMIIFRTFIGRGNDMNGFLYTTIPLQKEQLNLVPGIDPNSKESLRIKINGLLYSLGAELDPHWHRLYYGQD